MSLTLPQIHRFLDHAETQRSPDTAADEDVAQAQRIYKALMGEALTNEAAAALLVDSFASVSPGEALAPIHGPAVPAGVSSLKSRDEVKNLLVRNAMATKWWKRGQLFLAGWTALSFVGLLSTLIYAQHLIAQVGPDGPAPVWLIHLVNFIGPCAGLSMVATGFSIAIVQNLLATKQAHTEALVSVGQMSQWMTSESAKEELTRLSHGQMPLLERDVIRINGLAKKDFQTERTVDPKLWSPRALRDLLDAKVSGR